MPVQIPRVQRLEPQAPGSVGRLDYNPPDVIAGTAPLRQGVNSAISNTLEAQESYSREVRKQEISAKDLKATEAVNNYEVEARKRLQAISQKTGDTTPDYQKYDEEMKALEDQLLADSTDQEYVSILSKKLGSTQGRLKETREVNQTKQYYKYQQDTVENAIKLRQDDAMNAASMLDSRDPRTFAKVKSRIDDIINFNLAQADQNGLILGYDEKGEPQWAPQVETKMRNDVGNAIKPMVKSLNAAGKAKEAKELIDQYSSWLNAEDKAKLTAENDEASVKNRALDQLSKLGPSPSIQQINDLKDVGEDVKLKMREINHTNSLHKEREVKQKADAVMNGEFQRLLKKQSSNTPYVTVSEYMDSPEFKNATQYLSPDNVKTLQRFITEPADSDPDAMAEFWEAYQKDELGYWDVQKKMEIQSKLNSRDRTFLDNAFRDAAKPTSDARKQSLINDTFAEVGRLFDDAKDPNDPNRPMFPKNRAGKYSIADQTRLNKIKSDFDKKIRENPQTKLKDLGPEIQNAITREAKSKADDEANSIFGQLGAFTRGIKNSFSGGKSMPNTVSTLTTPPPAAPTSQAAATVQTPQTPTVNNGNSKIDKVTSSDMSLWKTKDWRADFKKNNNRDIKDVNELNAWKKKRLGQ